jgi:hypothetical protein
MWHRGAPDISLRAAGEGLLVRLVKCAAVRYTGPGAGRGSDSSGVASATGIVAFHVRKVHEVSIIVLEFTLNAGREQVVANRACSSGTMDSWDMVGQFLGELDDDLAQATTALPRRVFRYKRKNLTPWSLSPLQSSFCSSGAPKNECVCVCVCL